MRPHYPYIPIDLYNKDFKLVFRLCTISTFSSALRACSFPSAFSVSCFPSPIFRPLCNLNIFILRFARYKSSQVRVSRSMVIVRSRAEEKNKSIVLRSLAISSLSFLGPSLSCLRGCQSQSYQPNPGPSLAASNKQATPFNSFDLINFGSPTNKTFTCNNASVSFDSSCNHCI